MTENGLPSAARENERWASPSERRGDLDDPHDQHVVASL